MAAKHRGFTLIEMLVVISIIGVLVALLMPAVQNARETARRAECVNNMRNVGVALISYSTAKGKLPARGRYHVADTAAHEAISDYQDSSAVPSVHQAHSWVVDVLPFLDQAEIYRQWNFRKGWRYNDAGSSDVPESYSINATLANTSLKVLTCPDDDTVQPGKGNLSFVVNGGFVWDYQNPGDFNSSGGSADSTDVQDAQDTGLMWANYERGLASITDGTSTTILLTESVRVGYFDDPSTDYIDSTWANPSNCVFQAPAPSDAAASGGDATAYDNSNNINNPLPGDEYPRTLTGSPRCNPSSYHPGGINVMFCDGHVQFISEKTISGRVWAKLITPRGGRITTTRLKQLPVNEDDY